MRSACVLVGGVPLAAWRGAARDGALHDVEDLDVGELDLQQPRRRQLGTDGFLARMHAYFCSAETNIC